MKASIASVKAFMELKGESSCVRGDESWSNDVTTWGERKRTRATKESLRKEFSRNVPFSWFRFRSLRSDTLLREWLDMSKGWVMRLIHPSASALVKKWRNFPVFRGFSVFACATKDTAKKMTTQDRMNLLREIVLRRCVFRKLNLNFKQF